MSEEVRGLIERFDMQLLTNNAALDRNTQAFDRNTQAFDRNTQAFESNNRAWGHTVAALKAIRDEIADGRDERRAQTRAILRMLDRLDEGGSAA